MVGGGLAEEGQCDRRPRDVPRRVLRHYPVSLGRQSGVESRIDPPHKRTRRKVDVDG